MNEQMSSSRENSSTTSFSYSFSYVFFIFIIIKVMIKVMIMIMTLIMTLIMMKMKKTYEKEYEKDVVEEFSLEDDICSFILAPNHQGFGCWARIFFFLKKRSLPDGLFSSRGKNSRSTNHHLSPGKNFPLCEFIFWYYSSLGMIFHFYEVWQRAVNRQPGFRSDNS